MKHKYVTQAEYAKTYPCCKCAGPAAVECVDGYYCAKCQKVRNEKLTRAAGPS